MVRAIKNCQVFTTGSTCYQTTWLRITGRKEVCREVVIDKLKPFQQTPSNIKECQMQADEIPEEDLNEEAVEPLVEPEDSQARAKYI